MKRDDLLLALKAVAPALGAKTFPAPFPYFCFQEDHVRAFNDVIALEAPVALDGFSGLVPGEPLLALLGAATLADVEFRTSPGDANTVLIKFGRSWAKLPCKPAKDYIFTLPSCDKSLPSLMLSPRLIEGLQNCLLSTTTSLSHLARFGVTLYRSEKQNSLHLYATDDATISHYRIASPSCSANWPKALSLRPEFFRLIVDQFKTVKEEMKKPLGRLVFGNDWICALLPKRKLFSKLRQDHAALDYRAQVKSILGTQSLAESYELPDRFKEALGRVRAVCDWTGRPCEVAIEERKLILRTEASNGVVYEELVLKEKARKAMKITIDPALVLRALSACSGFMLTQHTLCLTDRKRYYYFIAPLGSS